MCPRIPTHTTTRVLILLYVFSYSCVAPGTGSMHVSSTTDCWGSAALCPWEQFDANEYFYHSHQPFVPRVCVFILLCVLILQCTCPHTTKYAPSYYYVSWYYYICVRRILYMCPQDLKRIPKGSVALCPGAMRCQQVLFLGYQRLFARVLQLYI